jgi:hypothetical protein
VNPDTGFGRTVSDWLHADAEHRVPDHLDAALRRTRTERQRPAWSSPAMWLPMDLTLRPAQDALSGRARTVGILALVALLAAAALVFAIGARRHVPSPFGPAANGVIIVNLDGDLHLVDGDGSNLRPLVVGPEIDFGAQFSRDGSRFAFVRRLDSPEPPGSFRFGVVEGDVGLMVANADGTGIRPLSDGPQYGVYGYDWSPSGDRIALARNVASRRVLSVVDTGDPASVRDIALPDDLLPAFGGVLWRPTQGDELILTAGPKGSAGAGIYAIRPDGTGFREIVPRRGKPAPDGIALSPDGRWLSYTRAGYLHLVDLETGADQQLRSATVTNEFLGHEFSPDGRTGVMLSCLPRAGPCSAVIIAIDGSSPGRAVGPDLPRPKGPMVGVSPDGKQVVLHIDERPIFIDVATGRETTGEAAFSWFESWQRLPMP